MFSRENQRQWVVHSPAVSWYCTVKVNEAKKLLSLYNQYSKYKMPCRSSIPETPARSVIQPLWKRSKVWLKPVDIALTGLLSNPRENVFMCHLGTFWVIWQLSPILAAWAAVTDLGLAPASRHLKWAARWFWEEIRGDSRDILDARLQQEAFTTFFVQQDGVCWGQAEQVHWLMSLVIKVVKP